MVYTSGSTGRPKGVAVTQGGVLRLIEGADYVRLSPADRIVQASTLTFDTATFEIWGALLSGACLVMPPPGALSVEELGRLVRESGASVLWLTAGLFRQVVESGLGDLGGVRQLLAGGDALSVPHVERLLRELPGCRLIDGYGPTENTTFSCCYVMAGAEAFAGSVPIGRPIAGSTAHVLGGGLEAVPIGGLGELWLGGEGLARGYWGDPAKTAERFVPDPASGEAGARLYRSGDLGRLLADGRIEFLGRLRPPGEGAGLPHRARGGGGGARGLSRGARVGGRGAGGRLGRQAAGRLRGGGGGSSRASCAGLSWRGCPSTRCRRSSCRWPSCR